MNTITVEVTKDIAKKYGNSVVSYKAFLKIVEELLWKDTVVSPKMKMKDFYELVKQSDGQKTAKDSK